MGNTDTNIRSLATIERGGETELAFFEAFQEKAWKWPFWLHDMRHATREQDRAGIDAIARLDVGDIEIQIKSSHAGLRKHYEKHGRAQLILVLPPLFTHAEIRHKTIQLLYYRRGELNRNIHTSKRTRI